MKRRSFFQGTLIAAASLVVGMVIASRLDLTPASLAGSFASPAVNSAPLTGPIDATTFRNIAHEASPAVVSISIRATRSARSLGDMFGFASPDQGQGQGRRQRQAPQQLLEGAGSGFIIDKSGLIITNNHVIDEAQEIRVSFADSRAGDLDYPAEVVGHDELTDVALIRLTTLPDHPLTEMKFGDSSQMAQGDWVMAIGNPFRLSNSVSVGIVSAVGRAQPASISVRNGGGARFEEMIQTDAAINKGNSGGPLLNIRGEVIGMNTSIYSDNDAGGNIGIGFAVPINRIVGLLPQLRAGKVTRGRIGVTLETLRLTKEDAEDRGLPAAAGAIIHSVDDSGPARTAGLKIDDAVIEFNGKPVTDNESLISIVTSTTPGTTVPVKIVRDKKILTLNVKVEELNLAEEQGQDAPMPTARASREPNEKKSSGFGMSIQEITPAEARRLNLQGKAGGIVSAVEPLGAAAQKGIGPGDVILSVNGEAVSNLDALEKALDAIPTGRSARLVVTGAGGEQLVIVRKR